jgi:hypothetical protein
VIAHAACSKAFKKSAQFLHDFLDELFFDELFFEELFLEDDFFLDEPELLFFFGTFAPSLRASDKPIAIACFLLVTFFPEPPDFKVPSFRSCMAFLTLL